MAEDGLICQNWGHDWLRPYRNVVDGTRFLLCPECDSVWLASDDTTKPTAHSLSTMFAGHAFLPGQVDWDLIEPEVR